MEPDEREKTYVQIGLQQGLFSREGLHDARRHAEEQGTSLGEVLVERGALSKDQHRGLDRAVTYRLGRDEDKRIARIIVDSGYCEQDAVEAALERQKQFYGRTGELLRLGALLVEDGVMTDSQHVAAYKIYRIERESSEA